MDCQPPNPDPRPLMAMARRVMFASVALCSLAALAVVCATGCAPPAEPYPEVNLVSDPAREPVDVAYSDASADAFTQQLGSLPSLWEGPENAPAEEVRESIVSDVMTGVDPRFVDVETRLSDVEKTVDSHSNSVATLLRGVDAMVDDVGELSERVDVLENLPKAPAPTEDQWDNVRTELERQEKQLAELMAKLDGCRCGPDCTCGPECNCPDDCDPDCVCRQGDEPAAKSTVGNAKPYASITMLSRPGCPPCARWKTQVLPSVLDNGWAFTEEEMTGPGGAPQFRVCIGDACYVHGGFMTGNDLAGIVALHQGRTSGPVSSGSTLRDAPLRSRATRIFGGGRASGFMPMAAPFRR